MNKEDIGYAPAALTDNGNGADMKRQLNALGLFPHSVERVDYPGKYTEFIAHWILKETRTGQPATEIETAVNYALHLLDRATNIRVIATHTGYAEWRSGQPPLWSNVNFVIMKMEEENA